MRQRRTVKQAAAEAGISRSLLYELCKTGRLRHYRIGIRGKGRILIDLDDLEELIRESLVEELPDEDGPLRHIQ